MSRLILRRLRVFVPTLLLVSIMTFSLRAFIPGGPAEALAGSSASKEAIAAINERYGLDRPMWVQYFDWIGHLLRGDLGTSFATGQPVTEVLSPRIASTVEIVVGGLLVALIFGGIFGIVAAVERRNWVGRSIFAASAFGVSIPVFWISTIAAGVLGAALGLLPANGFVPISQGFVPHVKSIVMPTLLIALPSIALICRQLRSSLVVALESPYVRTAVAMGIPRRRIHFDLALRNAVVPVISFLPFIVAGLVGELVIIDTVFVLPGFGSAIIETVNSRDYATLQVIVLLLSLVVLLLTLAADITLTLLDPRRRQETR